MSSINSSPPPLSSPDQLMSRSVPLPAHTNPAGNIFGGWILSEMDLAGGSCATNFCNGPVATVAINSTTLKAPIRVGDEVSCYAAVTKSGRTSMTVQIDVWVRHRRIEDPHLAASGIFVYVAIDEQHRPRPIVPPQLRP